MAYIGNPPRVPTRSEVEACLKATDNADRARDHLLIAMAAMTGLRAHEVVALDWGQVVTQAGNVRRRIELLPEHTKGNVGGEVVVPEALRWKLARYRAWCARLDLSLQVSAPLFLSRHTRRLSVRRMQQVWKAVQGDAGIERPYHLHALRHFFGTEVYGATRDIRLTQIAMRHQSVSSTELPRSLKKRARQAWGWCRSQACDAARAVRFIEGHLEGELPDHIEGPAELVKLEREHRLAESRAAKEAIQVLLARDAEIEAERDAERDEDSPPPIQEHPVALHLEQVAKWMQENPDAPVPESLVAHWRGVARELEGRLTTWSASEVPLCAEPTGSQAGEVDALVLFGGEGDARDDRCGPVDEVEVVQAIREYLDRMWPHTPMASEIAANVTGNLSSCEAARLLPLAGAEPVPRASKSKRSNQWRLKVSP